ncbi:MAG: hypothetical protein BWY80_00684 [Firmicutes bacterium ADurb.Bin456]|nr:MAG: hypothetical protein BWY80_00684 [Firmicutes bacterium ADurb.Bin456]
MKDKPVLPAVWTDVFWSAVFIIAVTLGLVAMDPARMYHWFLIPVGACGALIIPDAVRWLRRRYDTFDPKGIIGLQGVHFFFLAPLLYVLMDLEMPYVRNPLDWRPWLGYTALLNFWGLLFYRFFADMWHCSGPLAKKWSFEPRRFWPALAIFVLIALVCQAGFFSSVGGLEGFVEERTARSGVIEGKGFLIMFGESFPVLLLFAVTCLHVKGRIKARPLVVIVVLIFFAVLQFFWAGLRGSRNTTIYAFFWAAGIIHYLWLKITPRQVLIGLIPFFIFMVVYGFFKDLGDRTLDLMKGAVTVAEMESEAPTRGAVNTIFLDLSRVDTQAYLVYKLFTDYPGRYRLALGRTYLGDVCILVPRSLWPDRPVKKEKEGTEILYGPGTYQPGSFESTFVYGLLGESLLNFHFAAVPFVFGLYGFFVAKIRHWIRGLPSGDARLLLAPFLVTIVVTALSHDLDNVVFNLVKSGLVPLLVVLLGTIKTSK